MPDLTLDTSGLSCPIPILKAKKALAGMVAGATLEVVATDPAQQLSVTADHRDDLRTVRPDHDRAGLAADRPGLDVARVEKVIYVGGSSLMSMVSQAMKAQFPRAVHSFSEVFTAVADGLAMAARDTGSIRRV